MSRHLEDDILGEPSPTVTGHEYDDWRRPRSGHRLMAVVAVASIAVLGFAVAVARGWV